MEEKLSQKELLRNLIEAAMSPFATMEKIADIKNVLSSSNNFSGINHLILVQSYFNENSFPFSVTKEEAIIQAKAALKDKNPIGYYYLYLLYKDEDEVKAKTNLIIASEAGYPKAIYEIGYLKHHGIIFKKNREEAFKYYKEAAKRNSLDGYFGLLVMYEEDGNYIEAEKILKEANDKGFSLPGVVR
jgi:TPR repeat protein